MNEQSWTDPRRWDGDVRDPNQKTPYELSCNDALQHIAAPYVVQLRELVHRGLINNNRLQYKVYLEWCQHQDLSALIEILRANNRGIPEPFIWYVAESMAMAGCTMETGTVPPSNGQAQTRLPAEGWDSIVHRDIKPCNVFLKARGGPLYPHYPTPTLGDWGLSFKTPLNDPNNPFFYKTGWGTNGFKAPEQMRWVNQESLEPMLDTWPVDSKTDVFAVGMVLRCLILGRQDHPQPWFLGNGEMNRDLDLAVPPPAMPAVTVARLNLYSMELRLFIDSCLVFTPANRLTFDEMLDQIRTHTDEGGRNLGRDLRSGAADLATLNREDLLPPPNTYALGLSTNGPGAVPPAAM